jgi:predicted regulator of Ras-like GTPase activity (Roadblock/LC7/MglB family)
MLGVLQQINGVAGVMGSLVCDEDGRLVAHSFPPLFDQGMLNEAALQVGECIAGLAAMDERVGMVDLRYHDSRILVRPLSRRLLMLFCQKTVNLQYLNITLRVAAKKLERLLDEAPPAVTPHLMPGRAPFVLPQAAGGKGVMLVTEVLASSGGTYWDQMLEYASLNRATALQISNAHKARQFKKIKLTNLAKGISKIFPVHIIADDKDRIYDGRVILSRCALESLQADSGATIVGELNIGGGIFGWEGI